MHIGVALLLGIVIGEESFARESGNDTRQSALQCKKDTITNTLSLNPCVIWPAVPSVYIYIQAQHQAGQYNCYKLAWEAVTKAS